VFRKPRAGESTNRVRFHLKGNTDITLRITCSKNVHAYAKGLGDVYRYPQIFVTRYDYRVGNGTISGEFDEIGDDQRIDTLLLADIVQDTQA